MKRDDIQTTTRGTPRRRIAKPVRVGGLMPSLPKMAAKYSGYANTEDRWRDYLQPLVDKALELAEDMDFKPTVRGLCYMLEPHGLHKGDFKEAEQRLIRARKMQMLPVDFFAEDTTRIATSGGQEPDNGILSDIAAYLSAADVNYRGCSTLDHYDANVLIVVEKLDLVGLFKPVADAHGVPIYCGRGNASAHQRVAILKSAESALETHDKPTAVLLFGDHDVGGLDITNGFANTLEEWLPASEVDEWVLDNISTHRIGLNADDIEALGLTWIDGLGTGGDSTEDGEGNTRKRDLADPSHPQHYHANVQSYLAEFGPRKVEANALMADVKGARALFLRGLREHVSQAQQVAYTAALKEGREAMARATEAALAYLRDDYEDPEGYPLDGHE